MAISDASRAVGGQGTHLPPGSARAAYSIVHVAVIAAFSSAAVDSMEW